MTTPTLAADARNRALRTLLQGLGFTIASAVVIALLAAVTSATTWSELGAVLVGFAFFQSIAVSALSWLMRAYLDRSSVPTPTPPSDRGAAIPRDSIVLTLAVGLLGALLFVAGALLRQW